MLIVSVKVLVVVFLGSLSIITLLDVCFRGACVSFHFGYPSCRLCTSLRVPTLRMPYPCYHWTTSSAVVYTISDSMILIQVNHDLTSAAAAPQSEHSTPLIQRGSTTLQTSNVLIKASMRRPLRQSHRGGRHLPLGRFGAAARGCAMERWEYWLIQAIKEMAGRVCVKRSG